MDPLVGAGNCMMARPVVLLPQPDSPTIPSVSPLITSNEMPLTALTLSPVLATGNSTTRSLTLNRTSGELRTWALPVPAISSDLLLITNLNAGITQAFARGIRVIRQGKSRRKHAQDFL